MRIAPPKRGQRADHVARLVLRFSDGKLAEICDLPGLRRRGA
jgi:hypothetical protein